MGFPLGKTKPFLESLVQRLRNTGGGIPSRPYIYICTQKLQVESGKKDEFGECMRAHVCVSNIEISATM